MKVKVFSIIFSFAFIYLSNSALLGAKECTYGPAYWCSNIANAKQCNAMDHCIQAVWEKENLPEDNDDICNLCKDMVKQARDQLLSNETQDEIRQVFEGSCKLIPVSVIMNECIKLSDDFIPQLIDTLASQMKPQVVCATAGLCNSIRVDRLLEEYHNSKTDQDTDVQQNAPRDCKDCKTFISDIVDKVHSVPRSQVLDQILAICGRLGSFSDGCMSLVQTNFNFLYDFLKNGLHPQDFCDVFGMCARLHGMKLITAPRTADVPCDFCVAVVGSWRENFLANTTKEEFRMILDGVCEHTGNFQQECHALVDQYFDMLYDIIISEIDPKEICEAVGLCGPNSVFNIDVPVWTMMEMRPDDHLALESPHLPVVFTGRDEANSYKTNDIHGSVIVGRDEANSYKTNDVHLPKVSLTRPDIVVVNLGMNGILKDESMPKVVKSDQCIMCEFVLHFLQNALNDKETRDQIKNEVDQVCTLLPHSLAEQCQDYVDAYGDQIIQLIELEIDPATVCPMLHLCPAVNMYKSMTDDSTCILCEYVMTELDEIIGDNDNEDSVKRAVETVCQYLPKSIRPECKYFIDMYIDQIVDLLVNDFTPKEVCAQIGLCPKSNFGAFIDPQNAQLPISRLFISTNNLIEKIPKKDVEKKNFVSMQSSSCIICEFIVSKIDSSLVTNATEQEIRQQLDRVCLLLPNTLSNDCLGFMDEYMDTIVQLLVKHLDPVLVCQYLKLCDEQKFIQGMIKAEVKIPFGMCYICEEVVGFLDQRLKYGKVISDLISLVVSDVCSLMPSKTAKKCNDFITKYNDFIIMLIYELLEPKRVCQALKMCPQLNSKPLLGGPKCARGPVYRCQSKLHAESCNVMKDCTETVWMGVLPDY